MSGKGDPRVRDSSGGARGPGTIRGRSGRRLFEETPLLHRGLPDVSVFSGRTTPNHGSPTMMAPPPPRLSAYAEQHTRPTRAPPVRRSDPPTTWAAVTSRRPLQNTHTPTDDSYLDVRVPSLRHHNYDFPTTPRDVIFALATTTFDALEDVGRSKASLRFALDIALNCLRHRAEDTFPSFGGHCTRDHRAV